MKKTLLSILLIISMLSFYSCDDNSLPEVTATEASEALGIAVAAYTTSIFIAGMNGSATGFSYATDSNGLTMTFSSYDVSGMGTYSSISGTIVVGADSTTFNLSFADGAVVTLYMVLDSTGATAFEVNGHDMLSEVTITATH